MWGFPHSDADLPSDLSSETQPFFYSSPLSSARVNTRNYLTLEATSALHSKMLCTIILEKGPKKMKGVLSWDSRRPKLAGTEVCKLIFPHLVVRFSLLLWCVCGLSWWQVMWPRVPEAERKGSEVPELLNVLDGLKKIHFETSSLLNIFRLGLERVN